MKLPREELFSPRSILALMFACKHRLPALKLSRTFNRAINMSSTTFPPEELRSIVQEVATLLKERSETISVAETVSMASNMLHPL
jgi:hypothetical protein